MSVLISVAAISCTPIVLEQAQSACRVSDECPREQVCDRGVCGIAAAKTASERDSAAASPTDAATAAESNALPDSSAVGNGAAGSSGSAAPPSNTDAVAGCRCSTVDACCDGCQPRNDGGACPSDDLECTSGSCRAGSCVHQAQPGFCMVGGLCFADGAENPARKCQVCDAARNPGGWSDRPPNAPCEDGMFCNGAERCGGGSESGQCLSATDPCRTADDPCRICDEVSDKCTFSEEFNWADSMSHLVWKREAIYGSFDQVTDTCAQLALCGVSDWRLASISELRTLIRGCSVTQTGGSCGVTDSCLADSCESDLCHDGCRTNMTTFNGFIPPEIMNPRTMTMSSSMTLQGGVYLMDLSIGSLVRSTPVDEWMPAAENPTRSNSWAGLCVADAR